MFKESVISHTAAYSNNDPYIILCIIVLTKLFFFIITPVFKTNFIAYFYIFVTYSKYLTRFFKNLILYSHFYAHIFVLKLPKNPFLIFWQFSIRKKYNEKFYFVFRGIYLYTVVYRFYHFFFRFKGLL